MPFEKWEDMKQMKRLTNKNKKIIILQSLPIVILAAIAFITIPSLLPENNDSMKESVALIECREYYEIMVNGKCVAVCNDIKKDSTLDLIKEKADSDTERRALVCGCWINKYSFMPSCHGRIITVNPFYSEPDLLPMVNSNIKRIIEKTVNDSEKMLKADKKKQDELEYYLNTHSVKDEGYNTMATYTEENKKKKQSLEKGIEILNSLKKEDNIKIRKKIRYTLLYPGNDKKVCRIMCEALAEESKSHDKGTVILQTSENFMPEKHNSVYTFKVFCLIPEKGDSITVAGIFGMNAKSSATTTLQQTNTFKGVTTSLETHNIPQLLAPDGAPLFNRNGYFIGINNKGRIVQ